MTQPGPVHQPNVQHGLRAARRVRWVASAFTVILLAAYLRAWQRAASDSGTRMVRPGQSLPAAAFDRVLPAPVPGQMSAPLTLADLLDGRPLYLGFVSTDCPISHAEMPALLLWAAQHPELRVVVALPEQPAEILAYFAQFQQFEALPVEVVFDPNGAAARRYGVWGTPSSFLTDAHGVVFYARAGGPDTSANFNAHLGKLNITWSR